MSFFQLKPRNDATDPYNGTWEAEHRTLLIVIISVLIALIVLTPALYFTIRALKARSAKTGNAKLFVGRPPYKRKGSDTDSDDDWDFPPCSDAPRSTIQRDAEQGTVRETKVDRPRPESMHAIDLNTPIIARFPSKEQSTPKGVWEKIAAKRKSLKF